MNIGFPMAVRFSIIVPVYDQWHLVPRLLRSLSRQTWMDGGFELLLVDNGSRNFQQPADLPPYARVLTCDLPGSYAARNKGIETARGDWLLFTDADCVPADDWLERIDGAISSIASDSCLIAGAIHVTAGGQREPNPYQIYEMVKGIPQAHYVRWGYAATANLCVPSQMIREVGAFDPERYSGGDADLCLRARKLGYRVVYLPDIVVEHPARDTWQALATKARRVKGGQLSAGSTQRRALYFARSFAPPVIAVWRFFGQRHLPYRFRAIAVLVQLRIWLVDMHETLRLSFGTDPERR